MFVYKGAPFARRVERRSGDDDDDVDDDEDDDVMMMNVGDVADDDAE